MHIPIEISARHIHLTLETFQKLFGVGAKLHLYRYLSQPGQYAARETLRVVTPHGSFQHIRIIGPCRDYLQLEISKTDAYRLGIDPPVCVSGDLEESVGGVELIGQKSRIRIRKGVIIAQRHLHISPDEAIKLKVKQGSLISIKTRGQRALTFHNVYVRSREGIDELAFQLDTDEANAAGVKQGELGEIVR